MTGLRHAGWSSAPVLRATSVSSASRAPLATAETSSMVDPSLAAFPASVIVTPTSVMSTLVSCGTGRC